MSTDFTQPQKQMIVAISWCLAWGRNLSPHPGITLELLHQMREAILGGQKPPAEVEKFVRLAQQFQDIPKDYFPETLSQLKEDYPALWEESLPIGLVYGGATKIKQYVFEASKLQDIRGASALLDRINLIDLPAFFKGEETNDRFPQCARAAEYCRQVRARWLQDNFPSLEAALIPEMVIYSTGSNILAFCPAAYVDALADAIEKRYTHETLTANSCAVGQTFRLLELRFGSLKEDISQTPWLAWYRQNATQPLVEANFGKAEADLADQFKKRKSFNELVRQLTVRFSQRRSGDDRFANGRPSRRYPPMFETHPYGRRDGSDRRLATAQAKQLPGEPWFSDVTARKRVVGQTVKRENQQTGWFTQGNFGWEPGSLESWTRRFEAFLTDQHLWAEYDPSDRRPEEARSLREIGNASSGFVAYIYADGNNMGGYIQTITTAEEYQQFSEAVSIATEHAVYYALKEHLKPHQLNGIEDPESENRNGTWVHPFEILTIGGDDVMLVVPANKALAIAQTLSEQFECLLSQKPDLSTTQVIEPKFLAAIHRYRPETAKHSVCKLSMSAGVLVTAEDTPIYYAEKLTSQLLKSAKNYAKSLKKEHQYLGGTIDFLVLKAITMLSSKVTEFRESGLVFGTRPKLKLYGAPYTLHEIEGLLATAQALKQAEFPRSQLYQIRNFLEQGKHPAMLNYRYFWSRLKQPKAKAHLKREFEDAWCTAKTNDGNLVPWMYVEPTDLEHQDPDYVPTYETIWRELVDLYPFIDESEHNPAKLTAANREEQ